jgi:hypothetical protein
LFCGAAGVLFQGVDEWERICFSDPIVHDFSSSSNIVPVVNLFDLLVHFQGVKRFDDGNGFSKFLREICSKRKEFSESSPPFTLFPFFFFLQGYTLLTFWRRVTQLDEVLGENLGNTTNPSSNDGQATRYSLNDSNTKGFCQRTVNKDVASDQNL